MAQPTPFAQLAEQLHIDVNVKRDPSGQPEMTEEDETLVASYDSVCLLFGDGTDAGAGVLHLTTRRVVWAAAQACCALSYKQIVMHAISRDPASHSKSCIYLQLDEGSEDMMAEGEEEEEECVPAELRFVPHDEGKVEEIFKHMCDAAALNPDSDAGEDGEGEFFFDRDEVLAGVPPDVRAAVLAQELEAGMDVGEGEEEGDLEELVGDDPERFADAEEEVDGDDAAAPAGRGTNGGALNGMA